MDGCFPGPQADVAFGDQRLPPRLLPSPPGGYFSRALPFELYLNITTRERGAILRVLLERQNNLTVKKLIKSSAMIHLPPEFTSNFYPTAASLEK